MSTAAPARSEVFLRTDEQRLAALKRANEIRAYRAALKRKLKVREIAVAAVLADPPEEIWTMKVRDLLRAVPGLGVLKASRVMNECRISDAKTVGGLSDRQRHELVRTLGGSV